MRTATIYNFLLEANIMASIAIILMVIVRKFFRKQLGNKAVRYAWLLVVARLLLPISLPNPFISEIRPAYLFDDGIRPIAGQIKIRLQDALASGSWTLQSVLGRNNIVSTTMSQVGNRMSYGISARVLMQYYLFGVGLVLLWFLVSNILFRWKMRAGRIEPISGELKEEFDQICRERKVKPVPVYFTDPLASACLVGVFRPYIALPLSARPNEVSQVLTHEICHLKGHDHIWSLVRLICCAVHWFNPLVWLAAWMSRTDCELACDDRVIAPMDDAEKRDYASVLVLAAARRNSPGILTMATGMTMTGKRLKDRVDGILHSGTVKRGAALSFALLASMCLVGAFATSEMQQVWNLSVPTVEELPSTDLGTIQPDQMMADQDALDAFGVGFWGGSFLQEDNASAPFTITQEDGIWRISDASEDLVLHFDAEGKLLRIGNSRSGFFDADTIDMDIANTPVNRMQESDTYHQKMERYENQLAEIFFPQIIPDIDYFALTEERRNGDLYYAIYVVESKDAEQRHRAMFAIQTEPTFRLVWLTLDPNDINYNGNG